MGAHQQVHELRMKFTDPDGYKNHMMAKDAHQSGNSNAVQSNSSIQGRGTSGGREKLGVKNYSMNAAASTPSPSRVAAPAPKAATIPKSELKPPKPIEYSPEIQQAKERAQTYQADALSGNTSEEIYGNESAQGTYLNKYQLNLNS